MLDTLLPQLSPETTLAELRELSAALHETRRALRADWASAGGSEHELAGLLRDTSAGEPEPEAAADALGLPAHGVAPLTPAIRLGVLGVRRLRRDLAALLAEPGARALADSAITERARVLRAALRFHRGEGVAEARLERAAGLVAHAAAARRALTPGEREIVAAAEGASGAELVDLEGLMGLAGSDPAVDPAVDPALDPAVDPAEDPALDPAVDPAVDPAGNPALDPAVLEAVGVLRIREAQRQLRAGLLLNEQMRSLIRTALPALHSGAPILLIGETGGAKTALAESLARRVSGECEFVSGYGDISAAQLIGTHELRNDDGVPVTAFEPGPLLRAMRTGVPLILDEVNAMPAEFLKRLNRILQLRPGGRLAVQEQAGLSVDIAPGFVIIATANEHAPGRYRGIEPLSAELVNRFGANTLRVRYPDAECDYTEYPRENALLVTAAIANERGELPRGITPEHIARVARAAFISQQVFSGNHGEGFDRFLTTDRASDDEPGLEETVIAPRTLVGILERAALEGTAEALHAALARFVDGVMHREDRRVLALILRGQGISA